MSNKKIINIVKGDIESALEQETYIRNTDKYSNIEFDTQKQQILLDGVPYSNPQNGDVVKLNKVIETEEYDYNEDGETDYIRKTLKDLTFEEDNQTFKVSDLIKDKVDKDFTLRLGSYKCINSDEVALANSVKVFNFIAGAGITNPEIGDAIPLIKFTIDGTEDISDLNVLSSISGSAYFERTDNNLIENEQDEIDLNIVIDLTVYGQNVHQVLESGIKYAPYDNHDFQWSTRYNLLNNKIINKVIEFFNTFGSGFRTRGVTCVVPQQGEYSAIYGDVISNTDLNKVALSVNYFHDIEFNSGPLWLPSQHYWPSAQAPAITIIWENIIDEPHHDSK